MSKNKPCPLCGAAEVVEKQMRDPRFNYLFRKPHVTCPMCGCTAPKCSWNDLGVRDLGHEVYVEQFSALPPPAPLPLTASLVLDAAVEGLDDVSLAAALRGAQKMVTRCVKALVSRRYKIYPMNKRKETDWLYDPKEEYGFQIVRDKVVTEENRL